MKTPRLLSIILCLLGTEALGSLPQQIQPPARGSLPAGARRLNRVVPLMGFRTTSIPIAAEPKKKRRREPETLPREQTPTAIRSRMNFSLDSATMHLSADVPPLILESFAGVPRTGSFPPDPVIAAGPNHIVAIANSEVRILRKDGTLLETINAAAWLDAVCPGCRPYDPRVLFDSFTGRFLMLWHHFSKSPDASFHLFSISSSDDPTAAWLSWAMPADVTGDVPSGTWADNGCLGYDSSAVYIVSNQYSFDTMEPKEVKVRILSKRDIFSGKDEGIQWTDILIHGAYCVRPAAVHGHGDAYYLLEVPNPLPLSTVVTLYRIDNPLTDPSLTARQVSVSPFGRARDAGQPGTDVLFDTRKSFLHSEIQMAGGFLHAVFAVDNPLSPGFSSLRYLRIDPALGTAETDITFGAPDHWYFYPAVAVDQDGNVMITFAMSSAKEYAGSFFTWRLAHDGPSLRPSQVIQQGWAQYREVDGYGANRWGDYSGAAIDPTDGRRFWLMGEYAEGVNRWGTWVKSVRLVPYEVPTLVPDRRVLDFGNIGVNTTSGRSRLTLRNGGSQPLTIASIGTTVAGFSLIEAPSFPAELGSYDSLGIDLVFTPADTGATGGDLVITSNDPVEGVKRIALRGAGISIPEMVPERIYAVRNERSGASLCFLNAKGETEWSVPLAEPGMRGLSVGLWNRQLYGVMPADHGTLIVHVDAPNGRLYAAHTLAVHGVASISASDPDTLYCATDTGSVCRYTPSTSSLTPVVDRHGIGFSGLVSSGAGRLWATAYSPAANDTLYLIDVRRGTIVPVGRTGFMVRTSSLCRAPDGGLFALVDNAFTRIDTVTGNGTFQFYVPLDGICAIAAGPLMTDVTREASPATKFRFCLEQNYPNPFNPSTTIKLELPKSAVVKLAVYDLLGREVSVLVNERKDAGVHEVEFDGSRLASGVYLYRLTAGSFVQTRKLVFIR